MIEGMKHLLSKGILRDLGLFSLKKALDDLQYLKVACKKSGGGLWTCNDRRRGDGFKMKESRFKLDIGKKFFTV